MELSREEVVIELHVISENYDFGKSDHCWEVVDEDGEEQWAENAALVDAECCTEPVRNLATWVNDCFESIRQIGEKPPQGVGGKV